MSFRKNTEKTLAWRQWLRRNEEFLNKSGLPALVYASERHWWDFLEHGFLDHHNDPGNFTVDELDETELRNLQNFLELNLTPQEKQSAIVLRQLESKLNSLVR